MANSELSRYNTPPSLKRIATVNTVAAILSEYEVRKKMNFEYGRARKRMREEVNDRLTLRRVPDMMLKEIEHAAWPMVEELLVWYKDNPVFNESADGFTAIPKYLCWTADGDIDEVRTFERHFDSCPKEYNSHRIDVIYETACRLCLERVVKSCWDHVMTSEERRQRTERIRSQMDNCQMLYEIETYWTCRQSHELSLFDPESEIFDPDARAKVYKVLFQHALSQKSLPSIQYFWRKLTSDQRHIFLSQWIESPLRYRGDQRDRMWDIHVFLWTQLEEARQQVHVLIKNAHEILPSIICRMCYTLFELIR